jgi:hypothetical protein
MSVVEFEDVKMNKGKYKENKLRIEEIRLKTWWLP